MLQIPTEELLVTDEDVFAAFQLDTPELKPVQSRLRPTVIRNWRKNC